MVSVIIPIFNSEDYLGEAIESVLAQTYRDLELILINDGATDGSGAIAQSYKEKDSRIVLLKQQNAGMAEALNRGIKLARNEWIVRMDADDLMVPTRIERQLDFVKHHPDIAVASSFVYYINAAGKTVGTSKSGYTDPEDVEMARKSNRLIGFSHPAVIMRKSAIESVGGYRGQFWPADDADLWNRVIEAGYPILVQPELLLKYRIHGGSVSVAKALFAAEQVAWVKACMKARRGGLPEPSREQFIAERAHRPFSQRVNSLRKAHAKAYYKAATTAWANNRTLTATFQAITSVILAPCSFFSKVAMRKITWKRNS